MQARLVIAATTTLIIGCELPQEAVAPREHAPPEPTSSIRAMGIAQGELQFGRTGEPLPRSLVVRVTTGGHPVAGEHVTFKVVSGSGSVELQSSRTDADGLASSGFWTLGDSDTWQQVEARWGNLHLTFSARACRPDRCQMVYVSNGNLHWLDLITGARRQLTTTGGVAYPAWSPDGRRIAFVRYADRPEWMAPNNYGRMADIYLMDADGSNVVRRTSGRNLSFPAWSPDGRTLAAATSLLPYWGSVFMLSADGEENPVEILHDASMPAWAPEGESIAVVSLSGDDGYHALHRAEPDGSGISVISPRDAGALYRPAWSPDGGRIAFPKCFAGGCDVVVMDISGEATTITNVGDIGSVAWSSAGQFLAVTRGRHPASPSIAILDPHDQARLITIVENGSAPAWKP